MVQLIIVGLLLYEKENTSFSLLYMRQFSNIGEELYNRITALPLISVIIQFLIVADAELKLIPPPEVYEELVPLIVNPSKTALWVSLF